MASTTTTTTTATVTTARSTLPVVEVSEAAAAAKKAVEEEVQNLVSGGAQAHAGMVVAATAESGTLAAPHAASGNSSIASLFMPVTGQLTFGALSGYCAGYAGKKIGKVAVFVAGVGFIALQVLSYKGYVTVNWNKIEKDVMGTLDANNDGKVTTEDVRHLVNKSVGVLRYNLPSSAGFAAGMALGFRHG